jgi:hypothetical protein
MSVMQRMIGSTFALLCTVQGPALYAYNNAEFRDEDWKGIRLLQESIKEKDPMKVGRFGLGFKSVFHMTGDLVPETGRILVILCSYFVPSSDVLLLKQIGACIQEVVLVSVSAIATFACHPSRLLLS